MDKNPLCLALEEVRTSPLLDLSRSSFHACGLMAPRESLRQGMEDWLEARNYRAESAGRLGAREAVSTYYVQGGPGSRGALECGLSPCPGAKDLAGRILMTASSSEAYSLIFQELASPGDNVLLPWPGYPLCEELAGHAGLEIRFYPLDPDQDWEPDLAVLDALVDSRTRFMVMVSPSNPCGSLLSRESLTAMLEICRKEGVMVVHDEVFQDFSRKPSWRPAFLSPGVPVFTLNGISKMFAAPDLKLAWIYLSCGYEAHSAPGFPDLEEIFEALEYRYDTYLNANDFSQFILPRLFVEWRDFSRVLAGALEQAVADLQASRLASLEHWRLRPPAGGIHFTLEHRCSGRTHPRRKPLSTSPVDPAMALAVRLVREAGIHVHPGSLYGLDQGLWLVPSLLGSIGGPGDQGVAAWNRLAAALEQLD